MRDGWPHEHPIGLKETKTCARCGYKNLYWHKANGTWKLHHFATKSPTDMTTHFKLHVCGYDAWGNKKGPPHD